MSEQQRITELLRDIHEYIGASIPQTISEHYQGCDLLDRIDAVLAGKLPDHIADVSKMVAPEGWQLVPVEPTMVMLDEFDSIIDYGAEDSQDAWRRMLSAAPKPESVKVRTITEGQELELTTVLQSIANGFSDDPAHDAAALLKRISGEVPWTGDSFQIPPRQGGEPCASEPRSSSPA